MDTTVTPADLGSLLAGSAFIAIAILLGFYRWKLILACIHGETAVGQVVRFESGKSANLRPCVAFTASNGQKVEYQEPLTMRVKIGEPRTVRYLASDPYCATSYPPRNLILLRLAFFVLFAVGGGATLGGTIWFLLYRNDRFNHLAGAGFGLVSGCILLLTSFLAFKKARMWHRRIETTGKVERLQRRAGARYPNPWISYVTQDGRKVEFFDMQVTGYGPGQELPVYYDPEYPEFTSTGVDKGGYTGQAAFFGLCGIFFLTMSAWFSWWALHG